MIITPTEIRVTDNRRQDLLASAARERRTAEISGPSVEWRSLTIRISTFVALVLGVRG